MRTRLKTITAMALLILLVGCSPKAQYVRLEPRVLAIMAERPPIDDDLSNLAPAGFPMAVWIDFQKVHRSKANGALTALVEANIPPAFPRRVVMNLLEHASESLTVSGQDPEGRQGFATILKGDFKAPSVLDSMVSERGAKRTDIGGQSGIFLGHISAFAPTEGTLVFGTEEAVQLSANLLHSTSDNIRQDSEFKDFYLGNRAGVMRYRRGETRIDQRTLSRSPLGVFKWIPKVIECDATLELGNGLHMIAILRLDTERSARLASMHMKGRLMGLLSNPFLKLLNVGWIARKILFSAEDKETTVKVSFSKKDLARLNNLIDPLLQIRQMMTR